MNGTKAKNDPESCVPLSMERSCEEYRGWLTPLMSRWGLMQHPVKKRNWGKGRGQGPGAKDLPEGKTLRMMMMMMMMIMMMMMMMTTSRHHVLSFGVSVVTCDIYWFIIVELQ